MTSSNSSEERDEGRKDFVDDAVSYPSKGEAAIAPRSCRLLPESYAEG